MGADRAVLLASIRSFRQEVLNILDRFEDELVALGASHPETPERIQHPDNDNWMTVKQVCEELSISDRLEIYAVSEEDVMKLPEIKFMTDEELNAEIEKLSQKVLDAKEAFRAVNDEAFYTSQMYSHLQVTTNEIREEYLGLREAITLIKPSPRNHNIGLAMLLQRMRNAYRDVRLESLRTFKKSVALLTGVNRAYREYILAEAECDYLKAIRRCREVRSQ